MMMPVVKGVSYLLVHTPDMVKDYGTTCALEQETNPDSAFLAKLPAHLRSYREAVAYAPNQVYIGNLLPDQLPQIKRPWYENLLDKSAEDGKLGEIVSQEEFYLALKQSDVFDLVFLERDFITASKNQLGEGLDKTEIAAKVAAGAVPLYIGGALVGCVRAAHEKDKNLSAHTMLENLTAKASGVLALKNLIRKTQTDPASIEYVIECSEEACGDMNQRGGGNFAKAIGDIAGTTGATGSDVRGFCAAPVHALIMAAALVQSGIYKSVAVVAGGATAKLGMNARDHIAKGLPVLEDCLGGFAILITENDGISPILRTDMVGRHTVGTGSSPQAVMESLITKPLDRVGLKITDIDKLSVEMQNPEITESAGAGDVPLANYKMIAALGVKRGDLAKTEMQEFIAQHGMPGFAPTQGHIPSGVPFVGHARELIMSGRIERAMIVGKGSLFLGRMTNLFDGVSIVMEKNKKNETMQPRFGTVEAAPKKIRVGLTVLGSEHGIGEMIKGAEAAAKKYPELEIVLLGPNLQTQLTSSEAGDEEEARSKMDALLETGALDAAVTMHYSFPIGVATVGRIITPGQGREVLLATTTGTSATQRTEALVRNALYGISTAKSLGIANPSVGILNVDGARKAEMVLLELAQNGYPFNFASSVRAEGGCILRGNDLLAGSADVIVTDTLTGNLLMKMFSAYTTGGSYESSGFGYGPSVGEGFGKIICIVSRASGAPVICEALRYAAECARGKLPQISGEEVAKAKKAGLDKILCGATTTPDVVGGLQEAGKGVPAKKPVTATISGIDILELDDALVLLGQKGIYAESGMGCTGPVLLVADSDLEQAEEILRENKFIAGIR